MSLIRTFTVTVANPGAGNRYYIDGVLQETVNLAEGYTYRFDVSDSSMGPHPFKFSTTSNGTHNGGSEYTTGVTTSGTTGQTDAYVQIVVAASAPQLYYYCQYHSGMGGQANTEPSDTWGLLQWNQNTWGNQDSVDLTLSGLSTTASVGNVDALSDTGWGSDGWGVENFGASGIAVSIGGLNITTTLGTVVAGSEEGWGSDEWGENNWGQNTTTVALESLSMSAHLGPDGWGINSFGNGQWGDPFAFDIESIIVPTGQTLSADLGDLTIGRLDMVFSISSPGTIGAGIGSLNINNGGDHTQGLASFAIPAAVGSISPADVVGLTGQVIKSEVNAAGVSTGDTTAFTLSSVTMSAEIGSISPADVVGLTGLTTEANVGAISPTNMTVGLTGQSITASINTVGFGTIGYQDVDITGETSYTDVNHAA